MHPLYVPVLGALRGMLGLAGYHGRMLVPAEMLNIVAAALTLTGLFLDAERRSRDGIAAALCVLLLGYSAQGFWTHSLRASPYALGAACVTASLLLLGGLPGSWKAPARFAAAGAVAALAAGFHTAAISLLPVAVCASLWEVRAGGWRRLRPFACFFAAFVPVLAAIYALFIYWHGAGTDMFALGGFGDLFRAAESIPGTSIYTSASLRAQAAGFGRSLFMEHGAAVLPLLVIVLLLAIVSRDRDGLRWLQRNRGVRLAFASFLFFSLFFLINNNRNSFIFAAVLLLPLPLAMTLARFPWTRGVFAVICLPLLALNAQHIWNSEFGPDNDPILAESRFLRSRLGERGVALTPGCPFPEMLYDGHLNFIRIGGGEDRECEVPAAVPGPALGGRIERYLHAGRTVFFAPGGDRPAGIREGDDFPRGRQISQPAVGGLAAARSLAGGFRLPRRHVSPQGRVYWELAARATSPIPDPADFSPEAAGAQRLARNFTAEPWIRRRVEYLRAWVAAAPEDGYAVNELLAALQERRGWGTAVDLELARLRASVLDKLPAGNAESLLDRALAALRLGDPKRARRELAGIRISALSVDRRILLADAYSALGESAKALALFDQLLARRPGDADLRIRHARAAAAAGKEAAAKESLARAAALAGNSSETRHRIALVYQELKEYEPALEIYRRLIRREATASLLKDKALCEYLNGSSEQAVRDLQEALRREPGLLSAYLTLASIHEAQGHPRQALALYERALKAKPVEDNPDLQRKLVEGRDRLKTSRD
ncbi:MAG: tetratricopeptide repeat protein [Elusimicrobiota bacterium]